ncbi:hypothetical protein [Allokutzneria albata]|uniref:hypothetical protein n=1 Tax=Allokutzneria albata TaxID=211114 RepID=UPI0012DC4116|nr:hypothetical protein [Allokutzneria albata]
MHEEHAGTVAAGEVPGHRIPGVQKEFRLSAEVATLSPERAGLLSLDVLIEYEGKEHVNR